MNPEEPIRLPSFPQYHWCTHYDPFEYDRNVFEHIIRAYSENPVPFDPTWLTIYYFLDKKTLKLCLDTLSPEEWTELEREFNRLRV